MFSISLQFLSEHFPLWEEPSETLALHRLNTCHSCHISTKLEFARQIFENSSNIKFHENLSRGSRIVPCRRTDRQKDEHDVAYSVIPQFRPRTIHGMHFTLDTEVNNEEGLLCKDLSVWTKRVISTGWSCGKRRIKTWVLTTYNYLSLEEGQ